MPDSEEKKKLLSWVHELPKREKISGYSTVLGTCATRYGNSDRDLDATMRELLEAYQKHLRKAMLENMTDPVKMGAAADVAFKAALLRMWVYASEYSRRWHVPELLDSFQVELAELTAPPKEE